jgi:hypothetical protein
MRTVGAIAQPDDACSRDLRGLQLALRMIRHEARTQTISAWTLVSPKRIRSLSMRFRRQASNADLSRHRGPPPTKLSNLLKSPHLNLEFSAIAGLCQWIGVLPKGAVPDAATSLPGIERGERLCYTLELFEAIVPYSRVTLDQLILLVITLAEQTEWQLGACHECSGAILIDLLGSKSTLCVSCEREDRKSRAQSQERANFDPLPELDQGSAEGVQQSLF